MTLSHHVCWRSISSSYAHTCCTQWLQMCCDCVNEAQQNAQCAARRSQHRTHCVSKKGWISLQWNSALAAPCAPTRHEIHFHTIEFAMKFTSHRSEIQFNVIEFCNEIHFNESEVHWILQWNSFQWQWNSLLCHWILQWNSLLKTGGRSEIHWQWSCPPSTKKQWILKWISLFLRGSETWSLC